MTTYQHFCEWCDIRIHRQSHKGPHPKYCTHAHRQAAYRWRQQEATAHADEMKAATAQDDRARLAELVR